MKYYDIDPILSKNCTFNAIFGGRGIGKTYAALRKFMDEKIIHIYLRRSESELKCSFNMNVHPYKPLNEDMGKNYFVKSAKNISTVYEYEKGDIAGYGISLSTFHNIKGVDFSEVDYILFDEFIKLPNQKALKEEGETFLNFYESVNRNRELKGKEPVRVIFLTNSVSRYSEIMNAFGLQNVIEMMERKKQQFYTDRQKSFAIQMVMESEVSEAKRDTVLYRAANESFVNYAIDNMFTGDSMFNVERKKLIEYRPICSYDNLYIYSHKSNGEIYVSYTRADCPSYSDETRMYFKRKHWFTLKEKIINGDMKFETFGIKKDMLKIMGVE